VSRTSRRVLLASLLAALLAACDGAAPSAPGPAPSASGPSTTPELAVAFLQDLSRDGATERALPVLQAVELAFQTAAIGAEEPLDVEVTPFDTEGSEDTAAAVAAQVAADPRFVAAVASPELAGQAALVETLSAGEVPLLSLSDRGSVGAAPPGGWLRLVAPLAVTARGLAETVPTLRRARAGVCLLTGPADGTTFARDVRRSLRAIPSLTEIDGPGAAAEAGCGVVVWTGHAVGGAELATALASSEGETPVLVGGPALRDPRFQELAGDAAEGTISVCSCADVSTSLELAAQRFIQDYQSEFGSPPGPYAVEAWDAAHVVIAGLREAGHTRADLVAWLASRTEVQGLGGTRSLASGELADPESAVRRYRVEGGRWTEVDAGSGR
jgi:ABC-type branched-subunit amino acid transport system substrate-binding protein